ncbi:MAG: YkgJ family cysteine cluster protein [Steroidobacter sp.]
MEFVIDLDLVRQLARKEATTARAEIQSMGLRPAFNRALQRHDSVIANAADVNTLACKQGCSWCCYFSVDVRAVETLNIAEYVRANFSESHLRQLQHELAENSRTLAGLDEEQRMQQNIKCPFLMEGKCSIYPVRPQTCRNYHATDAAGCKLSYEQPNNFDIAPDYAPLVYQRGATHVDTFADVMNKAGYDIQVYELNGALHAALNQPDETLQRFSSGQIVFPQLQGTVVPLEFAESQE